jgi:glutathione S-transferase
MAEGARLLTRGDADGAAAGAVPVLWHLKVSHYNEKARWALDYKGIGHERRAVEPGRHRAIARQLTGGATFPVLSLDGEAIGDSTEIIAALEARHPDPPLYPADPAARARALALEDYFDEELGPHMRILVASRTLQSAKLFIGTFFGDLPLRRRVSARVMFPLLRPRARRAFGIDDDAVTRAWKQVRAVVERFRTELQPSGYLVGDGFTVADLTLAALVAPAVAPPQFPYPQPQRGHPHLAQLREALAEAGLLEWAHDMYARHRGVSAEVVGRKEARPS